MRVLIVTPSFAPVVAAHSERAVALCRILKMAGCHVSVVSLDTKTGTVAEGYDPSEYADQHFVIDTGLHRTLKNSRRARWIRFGMDMLFGFPGPYVYESRQVGRELSEIGIADIDLIWVTTPPHELQLAGYRLARQHRIPYVMDLRDPWSESTRIRWPSRLHRQSATRWYRRCLDAAAAVVANSPLHQEVIRTTAPDVAPKLFCIPNGYFESDIQDAIATSASIAPERRCLIYAGSMYDGHVERVLDEIRQCADRQGDPLDVLVLGADEGNYSLEYGGMVPPHVVAARVVNSTYLFLFMPANATTGPVMSLKAYLYARSGKPIVYAGPKNETYAFLKRHSTVIDYSTPEALVETLRKIGPPTRTPAHSPVAETSSWEARRAEIERVLDLAMDSKRRGEEAVTR